MLDQAYSRRQFLGLAGGLASIVGLGLVGCGGSGASDAADKGSAAAESVSGEVTYDAPLRSKLSSSCCREVHGRQPRRLHFRFG